ncbi:MAG: RagB/SusD family nutrient uptake outer membrane protein [Alistipes sp.]|jgi:hypothetical protein|nr:RagB/SusD family nutrient uptake outer membrane protein [Alistipes sp.]
MTKRFFSFAVLVAGVLMTGCTNLDVDIKSELIPDNFPKTDEQYIAASGAIYSDFAGGYGTGHWLVSELSGDAALLAANGGNWFDGGRYMQLHLHSWNASTPNMADGWSWLFRTINTCNSVYDLLSQTPDSDAKIQSIAELRVMRALCYYLLMDYYGGVPLVTKFGEVVKTRNSRSEIFDFVESEVLECAEQLSADNNVATYGRPNRMTAYALLAKLYLNAEVFVGRPMWDEALQMCDEVIDFESQGKVGLYGNYIDMFKYNNGPQVNEFIFAIPYDENNLRGFIPSRYFWGYISQMATGYSISTSSCVRVIPRYYDLFTEDPGDIRERTFLTDKLYVEEITENAVGVTPLMLGEYWLEHPRELIFVDEETFDMGEGTPVYGGQISLDRMRGYRNNKFMPSKTQPGRDHSNDLPVFRYADILLMKAEAILRGATPTDGDTAVSLVNRVRERSGCAPWSEVDLDGLLDERGRELSFEAWRRNDLIRFGKYEEVFFDGFKTITKMSDTYRRVFPVPQPEIDKNSELEQNPGY